MNGICKIGANEWLCDRFNVAKPPLYFPNGFLRGSIPRWEQRKFILTKNFIKMKNSSTETFKHGIAKPMLCDGFFKH